MSAAQNSSPSGIVTAEAGVRGAECAGIEAPPSQVCEATCSPPFHRPFRPSAKRAPSKRRFVGAGNCTPLEVTASGPALLIAPRLPPRTQPASPWKPRSFAKGMRPRTSPRRTRPSFPPGTTIIFWCILPHTLISDNISLTRCSLDCRRPRAMSAWSLGHRSLQTTVRVRIPPPPSI